MRRAPAGIGYSASIQLLLDAEWFLPTLVAYNSPRRPSARRGFLRDEGSGSLVRTFSGRGGGRFS